MMMDFNKGVDVAKAASVSGMVEQEPDTDINKEIVTNINVRTQ